MHAYYALNCSLCQLLIQPSVSLFPYKLSFHLIYSFLKCHTGVRKPPFCQGDEDCTISTYSSLPLFFSLTWKIHVGSQKVTDKHFWDQMVGGHTEWLCLSPGCRLCTPDLWSGCASFLQAMLLLGSCYTSTHCTTITEYMFCSVARTQWLHRFQKHDTHLYIIKFSTVTLHAHISKPFSEHWC